jgi:amino acid transporter
LATTPSTQQEAAEAPVKQHSASLRQELGLRDLIFAQIVIVLIPDYFGTAAKAGASHVVFWLLGITLFFIPLTMVVVQLNRLMPLEGGLYEWARLAFDDRIGFLTAWNVWLFNAFYTGCVGLLTVTFISYAVDPHMIWIAENKGIVIVASIALIGTLILLAHLGLSVGKWVNNVGSAMTMFAIFALICMPLMHFFRGTGPAYHPLRLILPSLNLSTLSVFSKMIFGALTSFEFVAIFAGECRNPGRNIARASFIAAPILAFLYIFGTASILAYIPPKPWTPLLPSHKPSAKAFMECHFSASSLHSQLGYC